MRRFLAVWALLTLVSFNTNTNADYTEYIMVADTDYCLKLQKDFRYLESLKSVMAIPEIEETIGEMFKGFNASEEVSNMVTELFNVYQTENMGPDRMGLFAFSSCVMSRW